MDLWHRVDVLVYDQAAVSRGLSPARVQSLDLGSAVARRGSCDTSHSCSHRSMVEDLSTSHREVRRESTSLRTCHSLGRAVAPERGTLVCRRKLRRQLGRKSGTMIKMTYCLFDLRLSCPFCKDRNRTARCVQSSQVGCFLA